MTARSRLPIRSGMGVVLGKGPEHGHDVLARHAGPEVVYRVEDESADGKEHFPSLGPVAIGHHRRTPRSEHRIPSAGPESQHSSNRSANPYLTAVVSREHAPAFAVSSFPARISAGACDLATWCVAGKVPAAVMDGTFFLQNSTFTGAPSAQVTSLRMVSGSKFSFRNRTLPSSMTTWQPPGWKAKGSSLAPQFCVVQGHPVSPTGYSPLVFPPMFGEVAAGTPPTG